MNAELPPSPLAEFDGFSPRSSPDAPQWSALRALWNRRGIVLTVTGLCLAAAALYTWFTPRLYQSEARLFVRHGGLLMTGDGGNSATSSLYNQCKVITSTRVVAGAAARLESLPLQTLSGASPVGALVGGIGTAVVSGEDMITVTFDGRYPEETPQILEAVIESYVAYHAERKRTILEDWRDQQAQLRTELAGHRAALAKYTADADGADAEELRAMTEALTTARLDALAARTAHDGAARLLTAPGGVRAVLDAMRAAGVSAGADDPSEALRGQLLYARQQVRDARQRYLPEHPTVVAAEANVAALVAQVEQEARGAAESYVTLLGQRAEQAAQREESLRRSIEEQRQRAARARQRDAERTRVDADAQRTEQLLADVTQRIETFKLGKTVAPSVDVVEPPSTPTAPIRPHTFRLLMAGLLGGLGLGLGLGLVVDKTDQRLRSVEDIRVTVGVPILGTMPRLPGGGAAGSVGRNADLEPGSEFSESCRAIRTALFFGSPDVQARTILVTSPTPGEGKSTLASNLAISIARAGKRVLLVDADMRRPVQHRVFESAPDCDFPSLLAGGGDIGAMCVNSGVANLDILACGSIPHNPSELLNSRAFTELLEELTIRYDHVVLDSPPVTAVADAQILAAASSATILVLRADHSTRGATVRAKEALAHVGARVLGAVVNDVREKGDRYGRYGYTGEYRRTPDELKQLPPGKMAG